MSVMTTQGRIIVDDENLEICLTETDFELLTSEFNRASTQALNLVNPKGTPPRGILLPFPRPYKGWDDDVTPRRRDVRCPRRSIVLTHRGVGAIAGLVGLVIGLGTGWAW